MAFETTSAVQRWVIRLSGDVQGVGFRPYVYRLALEEQISGQVYNDELGVCIDAEGLSDRVQSFKTRLVSEAPPLARIRSCKSVPLQPKGVTDFAIAPSVGQNEASADMPPDAALCEGCLADITDPNNRRYRYAFTNCTDCGPRFSIIREMPYDRVNTTMSAFEMCESCKREYENPLDGRFHAQPNACPDCGPQLSFLGLEGQTLKTGDAALVAAGHAIRAGKIVAVKGIGGFHLVCDAANETAVEKLRVRKQRPSKPFAVMVASVEAATKLCEVTETERQLLASPQAPIVLLQKKRGIHLALSVAPNNPYLGVLLAYTPLHRLLLDDLGFPVIATSGNHGGDPIVTSTDQALENLNDVADCFLTHDRLIETAVEDSVVRVVLGEPVMLRRSRGYAPTPSLFPDLDRKIVALGGQFKTTLAKAANGKAELSAHIGALENAKTREHYVNKARALCLEDEASSPVIACDLHPDYASTQFANLLNMPALKVQHHAAHIYAVLAEHGLDASVTGLAWDGAGYGTDGSIWGGEGLLVDGATWSRLVHLRPFRLPGGDAAAREPSRCAIGLLHAAGHTVPVEVIDRLGLSIGRAERLNELCERPRLAPTTTSMGRLFDGVSALLGLCHLNTFEGEAAMALEFSAHRSDTCASYRLSDLYKFNGGWVVDWEPMLAGVLMDIAASMPVAIIARRFHNWLGDVAVAIALKGKQKRVVLGGGCFQNRVLLETVISRLKEAGFEPIWPRQFPPNDGGLALGQLYGAALILRKEAS